MDSAKSMQTRPKVWVEIERLKLPYHVGDKNQVESNGSTQVVRPHSPACSNSSRTESESGISSASDLDPPILVSVSDFKLIKKAMEEYKRECRRKELESEGSSSFRSSSEEKSVDKEEPRRLRRKRKGCTSNGDNNSVPSDGDISESGSSTSGNSSTGGGKRSKVVIAERSAVPSYCVSCCSRSFSSSQALYSHLRQVHNVGTVPNLKRRCKMCKTLVNEDLAMLHIELFHTISDVRAFKIDFGHMAINNGKCEEMYMELLPDDDE